MSLKKALKKTRNRFSNKIRNLFGKRDPELLENIEELLLQADFGLETSEELIDMLNKSRPEDYYEVLENELMEILSSESSRGDENKYRKPVVELYVGVNGVGKTTTIGKRGWMLKEQDKKVLLASGDTYRTGAVEQLRKWGDRIGCDVIESQYGGDPAAVSFDAVDSAIAGDIDYLLIDTAGRLHTRKNLMEEMKKIKRVLGKKREDLPQETILVIDATTGQNALRQAIEFNDALELTGISLSKLDGTAKGGIVVSISRELGLPVKFVGTGEEKEDLVKFDPKEFIRALF